MVRSRIVFPAILLALAALMPLCGGCEEMAIKRNPSFGPTRLRIHPTFTQMKDWTGDEKPDGVEVVVELLDEMDEPVRESGTMMFEIYSYRKEEPNPAGDRILNPWIGPLVTKDEQAAHWSPALRAYTFQLAYPKINPGDYYVLRATFETAGGATRPGGGRLFDQIVIEPLNESNSHKRRVRPAAGDRVGEGRG